jgi:raffinose/stachyose/melibiose transport system permease protein
VSQRSLRSYLFNTMGAWVLSLLILVPLVIVILASLKTTPEASSMDLTLPSKLQWGNYLEALRRGGLVRAFLNSLLIASVSAGTCILVSSMAGFVLCRNRTRSNNAIFNYIFLGLIAPINYITTIRTFQVLHIMNSYAGIILLDVALGIPFAVFAYFGYMHSIPRDLDEAAVIDGCSAWQLFAHIIFPLLKPVTITVLVLNFLGAWNDFISPLYLLNKQSTWPMVLSVYNFFGMHFNEWNMISSVILLSTLPVMILYLFGQRYIVSGMTSGAVKQ